MCKCLRNVDFISMVTLILLEICSLVMFLMILIYTFQLERSVPSFEKMYYSNLIHSILSLLLELIAIIIIAVFGIHSLYFKMTKRLFWYIIWYIKP
jgi:hypothetical protein